MVVLYIDYRLEIAKKAIFIILESFWNSEKKEQILQYIKLEEKKKERKKQKKKRRRTSTTRTN